MRDEPLPRTWKLSDLAERQHGVVSIRQLRRLGFSSSAVSRAVGSGRLHRLYRGVYAVGHVNLSMQGRCLAAVLASGPGPLLSHYSAAWLWGLAKTSPAPFHVTAPVPRGSRPPIHLHRARNLTDENRALEAGIPVTSVPRTILDEAATARADQLKRILKRAEELGVFDLDPVESLLDRARGHPGVGLLGRALAVYRPSRFTRSELELHFVELVEGAGLPRPAINFNEAGYELDVYWPELRYVVELDVFETHAPTSPSRMTGFARRI